MVFVGNFGSGKTEVAVNFALRMAQRGGRVRLADLDIVNPYFRCREARQPLEAQGVEVVLPPDQYLTADLPIVVPEIRGMIQRPDGLSILDVGGEDMGATVLSSLHEAFRPGGYDFFVVVNHLRPFTDDVESCLDLIAKIEGASRLKTTGIVGNSHLMDETTPDIVEAGHALAAEVAGRLGVRLAFVTAPEALVAKLDREKVRCPVLPLQRLMLPPWRRREKLGSANFLP